MIPLGISLDCEELILYSTQMMHEEKTKEENREGDREEA